MTSPVMQAITNPVPTVAQLWNEFRERVVAHNASPIQVLEMRRTFYAGFYACICASVEIAEYAQENDEAAADAYQSLEAECRRFADDVQAGRA